jgi:hypothetical protein
MLINGSEQSRASRLQRRAVLCSLIALNFTLPFKAWAGIINPTISAVSMTSLKVSWTSTNTATGYDVEASTSAGFTPPLKSSSTSDNTISTLTVSGLTENTTYFVEAGGIFAGTTNYENTSPAAIVTLADPLMNAGILQVNSSSIAVSWTAMSSGSGPNTAVGYELDASSTNFNGSGTISTSSNTTPSVSSLTVSGLTPNTTYFIRVGAINWGGVPNFVAIGSVTTMMAGGPPPINPFQLGMPGISSITLTWTNPGGPNGYVVNASTLSNFTGTLYSTSTFNPAQTTMTVTGLTPNTSYFFQVGALYGGTTSYSGQITNTSTLANALLNPQITQVNNSSITVNWTAFTVGSGTNTAEGYFLYASTTPNFSTTILMSTNSTPAVSTLTVFGLTPGATYYLKAGAVNWLNVPNFVAIGSTMTTGGGGGLPAPTNLHNIAITYNSINWAWNLVGSATGYTIYPAGSPTTPLATVGAPPWLETGLSTNTAYGIVVSAQGLGQTSPLSAPTTFYTQASAPGMPVISSIASSSFTVTWGTGGNPGYTPYQIQLASDPNFTVNVSTPIPFSDDLTANTTSVIGLAPNTPYYVRVTALNGNVVPSAPSSYAFATTKPNGNTTGPGSGLGTASLAPSNVPEGGVITATATFTVPSAGMNVGGRLEVDIPSVWWPNPLQNTNSAQDGYVTVTSTASASFNLSFPNTYPAVTVALVAGALPAGTNIQIVFNNIHPNCPPPNQTLAGWEIKSAMSASDPLGDIVNQSSQTYIHGPAQWIEYNPWNPLTVAVGQPSQSLVLQSNDNCGQAVPLTSNTTVNLQGFLANQSTLDSNATFSNSTNFSTPITSVTLSAGSSSATYYYETTSTGTLWIEGNYLSPIFNNPQSLWLPVTSLTTAPSFAGLSVDTGLPVAGQTSVTISPDGTGVNNFAYIRFVPSNTTIQWHVAISSNGFSSTVFDQWGYGNAQGSLSWSGQNIYQNYNTVPNATYTVKVEYPGLVSNTSMSITVNTSQISGSVSLGVSPIAGAQINAQGANGPGYSSTVSDVNGNYVLYGLHAGNSYNLNATYINPANQAVVTGQLNNISAPSSGQNLSLTVPDVIRVTGIAPNPAASTVFGNLNVNSSNYSQNYFGNLRLVTGSTTTDNGNSFNPSTWTVFYVQPGTYTIQLNMPGYGASPVTVSNSSDVVISLTQEASIYGVLTLPTPAAYPIWSSVSGILSGSNAPTVWGGASFSVGQSTAIYSIFSVNPGTYTFFAQVPGYVPSTLSNIPVGSINLGNPNTGGEDFPTFSVGGTISGTLTINGDTSEMASPLDVYLNAFSPQLGENVSTEVQLSTSTTQTSTTYQIGGVANGTYQIFPPYLQGFSASNSGPQNVVVSGGSGSANLVLTQETGQIAVTVKLPGANSDYQNVYMSLQGPVSQMGDLTSATTSILNLGTGFYNLTAVYGTTGAQAQTTINLTNGQTASVTLDLSAPTYAVSGTVSVQSGFSMQGSSGTLVTINTISDLLTNATSQNLYLGGVSGGNGTGVAGGGTNCSNVTPISTTTARVEAFPKSFTSFGNTNRSGLSNCYAVGQYSYGIIQADGSYSIPNLSPGLWEVDVYPYFDNGQTPDAASQQQFITVTSGNVGSINFALSGGNSVAGTVSLPSGVTDSRLFNVQILDTQGNTIQTSSLQLGAAASPASSVTYQFNNLAAGQYALLVQDPGTYDSTLNENVIKYVAAPVQFTISGANVTGVNVTMGNAARIIGTLGIQTVSSNGSTSLTLITPNNTNLLPNNFNINAQADPWVPGGSQSAAFNPGDSGPAIDANNHFSINGLVPGTYDVVFQQNAYGLSVEAAGAFNLASYTQGSVVVTAGQTVDLGVITLMPGISVSGSVVDASGNPVSNITVQATPSNNQHGQNSIQTTTDGQGNFTLTGLSSVLKTYDFVAAPIPGPGSSTPPVPYGQVIRSAVDVTQVPTPTVNFTLAWASAQMVGQVVTADGGNLSFPDGDQVGYPAAAVYLHLEGSTSDNNPLGQEYATSLNGSFTIGDLVPGLYDMTVESLGYQPYKVTGIALTNGTTQNRGTITLQTGAELDATLAGPDGSLINISQVQNAVAASPDLSSIIFGQITKDATTGNILSIKFSGFQVSPQTYNVLFIDQQNNITTPPEGEGLVFVSSSQVMTRALTYEASQPFAYTSVSRTGAIGTAVNLNYYFSRPLRNQGDDQDPSQWFTLTSALGTLSNYLISGDRLQLSVIYTPAVGEQSATIAFNAHTVDIDPSTGVQFVLSKTLTLLHGQKETIESNINPALGGNVSLAIDNDPSKVFIPGDALLNSDGSVASATTSFNFTMTATDDINSVASSAAGAAATRSAAYTSLLNYGPRAFVSEAYQAMNVAHTETGVNPLSSFYSILLPAGLSHSLNQTAYLTLSYDTTADPTQINVYYFDGTEYLLQNSGRTVDTVNHTITIGVSHFSTFVVLQNSAPVIVVNGGSGTGADIDVFNFPNPFDLQTKTESLTHGGSQGAMSTDGTIIRYFVPAADVGVATIRIYDVVGEKVRTISLGTPTADSYGYVAWDGRNDAGNKVASGVYIGVLDVGGTKKFWKMAVIK